jgi:peptidyl-prolyl cis-trans isomerase C
MDPFLGVTMRQRILIIFALILIPVLSFAGGNKEDEPSDQTDTGTADIQTEESSPSGAPAASGTILDTNDPEKYAAVVNGVGILREDYQLAIERTQQSYLYQGTPIPESDLPLLRTELLNQLVSEELLYQNALSEGIEADAQTSELQYQQMRAQFTTDEAWQQALIANNTDEDELLFQIDRNNIIQQVIATAIQAVGAVEQADIQAFYDANPAYFQSGEQVAARHILISTEGLTTAEQKAEALGRAQAIRDEVTEGADFAAVAREKSEGPSAPNGGDLGSFGRGQMVAPFEEAAFSLAPGAISEVVETQFGYHIIQVTEKVEADVAPLEDVSASIEQYLAQEQQALALEDYVAGLREAATIVLNE